MDTDIAPARPSAAALPAGTGPLAAYEARVASGRLDRDPEQEKAARRLDRLWRELRDYHPVVQQHAPQASGWLGGLKARLGLSGHHATEAPRPRGVYMVGQVGRGKTMLMDLFFSLAPVEHKRRILGRLFDYLFADGVVVVATSNTKPEDLFQDRPGADAFKPFIAAILKEVDTVILDSPRDYRRGNARGMQTWIIPANDAARRALDSIFTRLADGAPVVPVTLDIMGRRLKVDQAAGPVARFSFADLCGRPLGAGDYLALATRFPNLVLDGVPRMGPDNFDEARRFIVLIDTLYEQNVKLFASAEDRPDALYAKGQGATAFERTASRLEEMQSAAYMQLPHLNA